MIDSLRTRIAAAVDQVLNPPCCDECKPFRPEDESYEVADAVIRELGLATACESGCMWQIPNRVEDMTHSQKQLLKIAEPPSWGTPSFDNGRHND